MPCSLFTFYKLALSKIIVQIGEQKGFYLKSNLENAYKFPAKFGSNIASMFHYHTKEQIYGSFVERIGLTEAKEHLKIYFM